MENSEGAVEKETILNPNHIEDLAEMGYRVRISLYFERAWAIFKMKPWVFIGYFAISMLIFAVSNAFGILLSGCLTAGWYLGARKLETTGDLRIEDMFDGFKQFKELLLVGLLSTVAILAGTFFFVLPGIYLAVTLSFGVPIVLFYKADAIEALKLSRKLIHRQFISFFVMSIIFVALGAMSIFTLFLALIILTPMASLVWYAAYDDIVGIEDWTYEKESESSQNKTEMV